MRVVQGFWQINPDSINVNGQAILKNPTAIVDTGTTFIIGDAKVVGQFYSAVNATAVAGGFYTSKSLYILMSCHS